MTGFDEKFWDTAITEAATGQRPPDQTERILARLNAEAEQPRKTRRWLRYPLELAAAAALVLAIGLATGVVKWPWSETEQDTPVDPQRTWAAGPDSTVAETPEGLRLEAGWLLLKPGAPDVQCGESRLTQIDGLVLAHAGGEPSEEEFQTVQPWLQRNQLEEAMFTKTKWAAGLAMAVMVFNGSAMLDGQKVAGEPKPAPAEPEWVTVRNVMEIENLPVGTTHVRADRLSAKYLEFLAAVPSIEHLSFRDGEDMTDERLKFLTTLPRLTTLDLQGTEWLEQANYRWLGDMKLLKRLSISLLPSVESLSSNADRREEQAGILARLKQLDGRGVELVVGEINANDTPIELLLKELPGLSEITIWTGAGDDELKTLIGFTKLEKLSVRGHYSDVGLAHLAKHRGIKHLTCELHAEPSEWYQIGKMEWLTHLSLAPADPGPDAAKCFSQLRRLGQLAQLEVGWLQLPRESIQDEGSRRQAREVPYPAATLLSLPSVGKLQVRGGQFADFWSVLPSLRAAEVEVLWTGKLYLTDLASSTVTAGEDSSVLTLTVIPYGVVDEDDIDLAPLSKLFAACRKLKHIRIWHDKHEADAGTQPFIEKLRRAAPGVDVQYIKSK